MKIAAILFISIFLFTGCNKEKVESNLNLDYSSLVGTWELESTYSGMMPLKKYPPGNGQEMSFGANNYIKRGLVIEAGTYQLLNNVTSLDLCGEYQNDDPKQIVFSNSPLSSKQFIILKDKKLKIIVGCIAFDGGVSVFTKISDNFQ